MKKMGVKLKFLLTSITLLVAGLGIVFFMQPTQLKVTLIDEKSKQYLVQDVPTDVTFSVDGNLQESDVELVDLVGKKHDIDITNNVIKPKEKIEAGQIYYLTLKNDKISFRNNQLKDARKLMFYKDTNNKKTVELHENIKKVETSDIKVSNNQLTINGTYKNGDIVYVEKNEKGTAAFYKLSNVRVSGGKTVATIVQPHYKEVYKKIDVFETGKVDFKKVIFDKEILIRDVAKTGIFDSLGVNVYADVNAELEIDAQGMGWLTIEITNIGRLKLGVSIDFITKVELIDGQESAGVGLSIKVSTATFEFYSKKLLGKDKENFQKTIMDELESKLKSASIPIIVPIVSFVNLEIKIYPFVDIKVHDASLGFEGNITTKIGIFNSNIYFNPTVDMGKVKLGIGDKLETEAGIKIYAGLLVPTVVNVGIESFAGLFFDARGQAELQYDLKTNKSDIKGIVEAESGVKVRASIVAKFDFLPSLNKEFKIAEEKPVIFFKVNTDKPTLNDLQIQPSITIEDDKVDLSAMKLKYRYLLSDKGDEKTITDVKNDEIKIFIDDNEITDVATLKGLPLKEGQHKIKVVQNDKVIEKEFFITKIDYHKLYEPLLKELAKQSIAEYGFYDIDNNGIKELLTAMNNNGTKFINGVYYLKDKKTPTKVVESLVASVGGYRSGFNIFEDGTIEQTQFLSGTGAGDFQWLQIAKDNSKLDVLKKVEIQIGTNKGESERKTGSKLNASNVPWQSIDKYRTTTSNTQTQTTTTATNARVNTQAIRQGDLSSIVGTHRFVGGTSDLGIQFKSNGTGRFIKGNGGFDVTFRNFTLQNGVVSFKHSEGPGTFYIVPAGVDFKEQFSRSGSLPTDKTKTRVIFVEHQVMYFYID